MKRIAAALLALLALALLRRREPETVCRTDWHDDTVRRLAGIPLVSECGHSGETGPYCGRCGGYVEPEDGVQPADLRTMGLLYWHTNSDGRVQPVIQPVLEGRRE